MVPRHTLSLPSALLALAIASQGAAQQTVSVAGRVVESGTGTPIALATVELANAGQVLTNQDGRFSFPSVEPGSQPIIVLALGYAPASRTVMVGAGIAPLEIELQPAPIPLNSLDVALRRVDFQGRVRDADTDDVLVGAEVLTNLGRGTATDDNGRFGFADVYADIPFDVEIRAFGYLPLRRTMTLDSTQAFLFRLDVDPLMQRRIAAAVGEIEQRAAPLFSVMRSLDRDAMLRWRNATVLDMVIGEHRRRLGRIQCVMIDEVQTYNAEADLAHLVPQEIERIEFVQPLPAVPAVIMRVYTKDFIRRLVQGTAGLRRHPRIVAPARSIGRDQRDFFDYLNRPERVAPPLPALCR